MAPESERANCNVQPNHMLKNFPAACNLGTKDCILFHVGDIPTEPTLTCSKVVERLVYAEVLPDFEWNRNGALKILTEWRERRVQELEGLIAKQSVCSRCIDSGSDTASDPTAKETRLTGGSMEATIIPAKVSYVGIPVYYVMQESDGSIVGVCPARRRNLVNGWLNAAAGRKVWEAYENT